MKSPEQLLAEFNAQKAELRGQPLARPEMPTPETLDEKGRDHLVSLIFTSASGGVPHIVTVRNDTGGQQQVQCSCDAMMSISTRPKGCWAMVSARKVIGLPAVE